LIYSLYICYSKSDLSQGAQRETVAFRVLGKFATLCRLGLGLGLGLGGPWVAQGRPKRRFKKVLCLQQKLKKGRVEAAIAGIAGIARDLKNKTRPRINTDKRGSGMK
jgi:hypothetical protein